MPGRSTLLAAIVTLMACGAGVAAAQPASEVGSKTVGEQVADLKAKLEAERAEIEQLEEQTRQTAEILERMQKAADAAAPAAAETRGEQASGFAPASRISLPASPALSDAPTKQETVSQAPLKNHVLSTTTPGFVVPSPHEGAPQAIFYIGDVAAFRFFSQVQPTYEALRDVASEGYSQNFFLRRARLALLADIGDQLAVFLSLNGDSRLGYAGQTGIKNVSGPFSILDAWVQWALISKYVQLQAGLFLVPTVRQILTKNWEFLSMDSPTWAVQQQTVLGEQLGRDYGIGLNGVLFEDRLSYKFGVFDGYRFQPSAATPPLGPAAGSRNPPRIAGRLMYDFFEPEHNYAYNGTFLGKNHVASIAFVGDGQGDYRAFGGDAFFQWPVGPGSVTAEADYLHYDATPFVYQIGSTPTTLPEQETFFTNAGYCFLGYKVQPFLRYEILDYALAANRPREQSRFGGGMNYYAYGFNLKLTGYYERILNRVQAPTAAIKDQNRFVFQMSGYY